MNMQNIGAFICEYRTMFEDVTKTTPNIRPRDDVMYSSLDYGKIFSEMCEFLEGYVSYREKADHSYDNKIVSSTKSFYDGMFSDTSVNSPYRHTVTLEDMRMNGTESFLLGSQKLQTILESMNASYHDQHTKQLVAMTSNQYAKLAKVYKDDMSLYMWLATGNSKTNPHITSVQNRVNFKNTDTPVLHRLDQYK